MFGLCGSVWGDDLDRAQAVAERLECGVTYVNAHGVHRPSMPMLGVKWSGLGVENGIDGLLEYTERQVVYRAARTTDTALT
jgi:acyl-CoA reductase-like NAD-dependent aldehyde dehydrogenase